MQDPAELYSLLEIEPLSVAAPSGSLPSTPSSNCSDRLDEARRAAESFPLRVPRGFVARMRRGDLSDPLLRQVLPVGEELVAQPGFGLDPLQELASSPTLGLIHKYQGRALLVLTGACAVHCRYCFRRHFPYAEHSLGEEQSEQILTRLRGESSLREVILSGGDPLVLSDERLSRWVRALDEIPHLQRLRIHSRLPVVLPERVDSNLLAWLSGTRLRTVVVLHANHAREIDPTVHRAVRDLAEAGATVLNQAVLLAGVNDSVSAQVDLSEALFAAGILPYYLHQLDRVAGSHHFEVSEARAREIFYGLLKNLPGYLVPRLVRDVPGSIGKVRLELGGAAAYRADDGIQHSEKTLKGRGDAGPSISLD